jgi:hypothetical protein
MKHFDPAEYFDEQHYRVQEVAQKLKMGESTVRKRFKKHPRVRFMTYRDARGRLRPGIMLIPESVLKEVYLEMWAPV